MLCFVVLDFLDGLWLIVVSSSTGCSRMSSLAFHCLACRVVSPLCQPNQFIVAGNTSRLIQTHSHDINRLHCRHSWELFHSSMSSNCCLAQSHQLSRRITHYWEHIPSRLFVRFNCIIVHCTVGVSCWFVGSFKSSHCCCACFLLSSVHSVAQSLRGV
jgi:hypothetical protein